MEVSQPSPIQHIIGPAVLLGGATHAVKLISDAQWKHSSVEYEIVFHVRRYYSRTAASERVFTERAQCHEIITTNNQRRIYARPITHFLRPAR